MAPDSLEGLDPEMQTWAPCSREASATQNPMPEVPPRIRTRAEWSLDVYLVVESDILVEVDVEVNGSALVRTEGFRQAIDS